MWCTPGPPEYMTETDKAITALAAILDFRIKTALERVRLALSASAAIELVAADGQLRFKLHLGSVSHFLGTSRRLGTCRCLWTCKPSITGYHGVVRQRNGWFGAQHADTKTHRTVWLGMFVSTGEAALAYTRYNAGTPVTHKAAVDALSSPSVLTAGHRAQTSARRSFAFMRGIAIKHAAVARAQASMSRERVGELDEEERTRRHTNKHIPSSKFKPTFSARGGRSRGPTGQGLQTTP